MKHFSTVLTLLLLSGACISQASDKSWQKGKDWRLYEALSTESVEPAIDTLKNLPFTYLSKDTLLFYLKDATPIAKERTVGAVWMGVYWVSYLFDNHTYLLKVSP